MEENDYNISTNYMNQYLTEFILGLISGGFLGITGISPTGLVLLALEYFKIGDYRTNLGTIIFLNLFPLTIGSAFEFYKAKKVNFAMGFILFVSFVIGSYLSSKLVVDKKYALSKKSLKIISSILGFVIGIVFLVSAIYEKE